MSPDAAISLSHRSSRTVRRTIRGMVLTGHKYQRGLSHERRIRKTRRADDAPVRRHGVPRRRPALPRPADGREDGAAHVRGQPTGLEHVDALLPDRAPGGLCRHAPHREPFEPATPRLAPGRAPPCPADRPADHAPLVRGSADRRRRAGPVAAHGPRRGGRSAVLRDHDDEPDPAALVLDDGPPGRGRPVLPLRGWQRRQSPRARRLSVHRRAQPRDDRPDPTLDGWLPRLRRHVRRVRVPDGAARPRSDGDGSASPPAAARRRACRPPAARPAPPRGAGAGHGPAAPLVDPPGVRALQPDAGSDQLPDDRHRGGPAPVDHPAVGLPAHVHHRVLEPDHGLAERGRRGAGRRGGRDRR